MFLDEQAVSRAPPPRAEARLNRSCSCSAPETSRDLPSLDQFREDNSRARDTATAKCRAPSEDADEQVAVAEVIPIGSRAAHEVPGPHPGPPTAGKASRSHIFSRDPSENLNFQAPDSVLGA